MRTWWWNAPWSLHSHELKLSAGFQFFEASAKDNINVKQAFERLVDVICDKMKESVEGDGGLMSSHGSLGLRDSAAHDQGGCGC